MFEATYEARERALAGEGPTMIEAVTMRMHGHAAHDDMKYVPKELVEEWRKRDPIERQEARLRESGVDVDALRGEVTEGVFCEGDAEPLGDGQAPWSGFSAADESASFGGS